MTKFNLKTFAAVLSATFAFSSGLARADVPNLQNLNFDQLDSVIKAFGANLAFKPLEPASAYGDYFGVSFGVIGEVTSASKVRQQIPNVNLSVLPGGEIYLGFQAPLGLALELGMIPAVKVKDFSMQQYGGDLKWTINKVFFEDILPVDIAPRFMFSKAQLSYKQTISGIPDTIDFHTTLWGFNLAASRRFWFAEPYAGLGFLKQDATLSNTGNVTLFNQTVSLNHSIDRDFTSFWFYAGFQLHFFFANLTAQYDNIFSTHVGSAKIGFKF